MLSNKKIMFLISIACLIVTAVTLYLMGFINPEIIQLWLKEAGILAPVIYIILYVIFTILIIPSTTLNLAGGAIFGPWLGTFWTAVAAIIAAVVSFAFTRTIGREWAAKKLAGRWQAMDAELRQGGLFYMFAIRLLPLIPYGIVNFTAGLTSIQFKDYFWGTVLGTVPGILPFVLIGSFGLKALQTGDILPLMGAFALTGSLVGAATWYRRRRMNPQKALLEYEQSRQIYPAGTENMD